jgi:phage shock protein A
MGIFTRFADIVNANINSILDKAEDPEKMIRLIIQEMEDTLVEVRTASARTIAERKDLSRNQNYLLKEADEWEAKAELAINKDREDLARAALLEKKRCDEASENMAAELATLDESLDKLSSEVTLLQEKLDDARARQSTLLLRHNAASSRVKVRSNIQKASGVEVATKFAKFERKLDQLDATIEAQDIGRNNSLSDEISQLETEEQLEQQLAALKTKMSAKTTTKSKTK